MLSYKTEAPMFSQDAPSPQGLSAQDEDKHLLTFCPPRTKPGGFPGAVNSVPVVCISNFNRHPENGKPCAYLNCSCFMMTEKKFPF